MKRLLLALGVLLTLLTPLITLADHEAIPRPGLVPGAVPALVQRYDGNAPDYVAIANIARYRPRQLAPNLVIPDASIGNSTILTTGNRNGWDVFNFPNRGSQRARDDANFATFTLSRPAVVAIIWRNSGTYRPAWLANQGWVLSSQSVSVNRGSTVVYPVYTKSVPAGVFTLPGPYDEGLCAGTNCTATEVSPRPYPINLPWLAFAEASGQPSAAPVVPAGKTVPVANQTCPAWVHDLYQTTGPDGTLYPTWHQSIDPIYWCYFRHEHGSNPLNAFPAGDYEPPYGYLASGMLIPGTTIPMTENHWGHKGYSFQTKDPAPNNLWFYITQHFGTTGVARANTCLQRFHLVDIQIRNASRTETLVHLQFMGDYGRSIASLLGNGVGGPYTPTACPNGNAATGITTSTPSRQIPLNTFENYEPWTFNRFGTYEEVLGIIGAFTVNSTDAIQNCPDYTCDTPRTTTQGTGTARHLTFAGFKVVDPGHTPDGHFCTDGMAMMVVDCAATGAVEQYVKPGFSYDATIASSPPATGHWAGTRWGNSLNPVSGSFPEDPEGSIRETLGPN
jgi:hypothetical protein